MPKKVLIFAALIIAGLAGLTSLGDYTIGLGLIAGFICGLIYLSMLVFSFKQLTDSTVSKALTFLAVLLRLFVLAIPMLLACLYPHILNLYGVFAGEITIKICMYLAALTQKGGL